MLHLVADRSYFDIDLSAALVCDPESLSLLHQGSEFHTLCSFDLVGERHIERDLFIDRFVVVRLMLRTGE
jgi:hypothetical protein